MSLRGRIVAFMATRDDMARSFGVAAEALIAAFMLTALTRRGWPGGGELKASRRLRNDPELRMAAGLVLLVTLVLFLRPFIGAFDDGVQPVSTPEPAADSLAGGLARAAAAAWGAGFTALSFLTTTGWTSVHWEGARAWAEEAAPSAAAAPAGPTAAQRKRSVRP